jgi:hypothetical protein
LIVRVMLILRLRLQLLPTSISVHLLHKLSVHVRVQTAGSPSPNKAPDTTWPAARGMTLLHCSHSGLQVSSG